MSRQFLSVATACIALIGSAAATQEWLWTSFLTALVALLGLFEWIGIKTGGATLTRRFKEMEEGNKLKLTGGLLSFAVWLMYHLWLEK